MLTQPSPVDATAVLGRRFVAFLVDAIIATLIGGVVFFAVSDVLEGTALFGFTCADVRDAGGTNLCVDLGNDIRYAEGGDAAIVYLAAAGFSFLNMVVLQASSASIGKRMVGLAVVRQDTGGPLGVGKALLRWVVSLVDVACCALLGGILVLATKGHRRLGDMAAGSVVVARGAMGTPPPFPGNPATATAIAPQWGAPPAGAWQPPAAPTPTAWPPPAAPAPTAWEPPAPAAPPVAPPAAERAPAAAPPGTPQWDPARNAYLLWDAATGRWLQFDDASQTWRPLT